MTFTPHLFQYRALLLPWEVRGLDTFGLTGTSWHDGDTFNALVSRGENDYFLTHVRPAGYNAPEVYGDTKDAGEAAAAYARTLVDTGGIVYLDSLAFDHNHEEDNFGRMLAVVTFSDGTDLATAMIDSGHAVLDPA